MLRLDTSMSLTIGIFEHQWKGDQFKALKLLAVVDHLVIHWGTGMLQGRDVLTFLVNDTGRALYALSTGKKLLVTVGQQSIQFDLDGGDAAIGYLTKCLKDEAGKSSET